MNEKQELEVYNLAAGKLDTFIFDAVLVYKRIFYSNGWRQKSFQRKEVALSSHRYSAQQRFKGEKVFVMGIRFERGNQQSGRKSRLVESQFWSVRLEIFSEIVRETRRHYSLNQWGFVNALIPENFHRLFLQPVASFLMRILSGHCISTASTSANVYNCVALFCSFVLALQSSSLLLLNIYDRKKSTANTWRDA